MQDGGSLELTEADMSEDELMRYIKASPSASEDTEDETEELYHPQLT